MSSCPERTLNFPLEENRPPIWRSPSGNLWPTLLKSATDFGEIRHRLWENPSPIFGKSCHILWKISHRLWENLPGFRKTCRRLWENQPPTLGKWATDFGEICHRCCEGPFLGKWTTDFGKMSHRLWGNLSLVLWRSVFGTSRLCFAKNMLHCWDEQAPFLGQIVSKNEVNVWEVGG